MAFHWNKPANPSHLRVNVGSLSYGVGDERRTDRRWLDRRISRFTGLSLGGWFFIGFIKFDPPVEGRERIK